MQPITKSPMSWQFDHWGAKTVFDVQRRLDQAGCTSFKAKVIDGVYLMGAFDASALSFSSVAEIGVRFRQFQQLGIEMRPWVNARGMDIPRELDLIQAAAEQCGGAIEIDLEPYPRHWTGPYAAIPAFFAELARRGLTVDMDFHFGDWAQQAVDLPAIAPHVRRIFSQSYWLGFGQDAVHRMRYDCGRMKALGRPFGPIFPANDPANFSRAAAAAQELGADEISLWAMDNAKDDTYAALAAVPGKIAPMPIEPPAGEVTPQQALDEIYRVAGLVGAGYPAEADTLKRMAVIAANPAGPNVG